MRHRRPRLEGSRDLRKTPWFLTLHMCGPSSRSTSARGCLANKWPGSQEQQQMNRATTSEDQQQMKDNDSQGTVPWMVVLCRRPGPPATYKLKRPQLHEGTGPKTATNNRTESNESKRRQPTCGTVPFLFGSVPTGGAVGTVQMGETTSARGHLAGGMAWGLPSTRWPSGMDTTMGGLDTTTAVMRKTASRSRGVSHQAPMFGTLLRPRAGGVHSTGGTTRLRPPWRRSQLYPAHHLQTS